LSGYRRIEPQFCRGCGTPWVPGADACPSCGEAIARLAPSTGDAWALPKVRAVLVVAGVMLLARWGSASSVELLIEHQWCLALTGILATLAVVSARWWYPGRMPHPLWGRPRAAAWPLALVVGLALPLGVGALVGRPADVLLITSPDLVFWYGGQPWWWIALAFVGFAFEEAFFRGLLFDGIAAIGGTRNAAIASALVFALVVFDPFLVLVGIAAAMLRAWSGAVAPSIVLRLVAAGAWLGWCALA
jgi:membrane protease YdiL (CAAX protease family)